MHLPRLVIAAPNSGAGKTTLTVGVLLALRARGMTVQPFKVGPDFIDASHHSVIAGRPSRNLDSWMCDDDAVREIFSHAARDADISLIEGVMGLYDGSGPRDERGSTAHVAKLLDAPVVLVIDAQRMAGTAAAVALGCRAFDAAVRIAGVIFNNVGSAGHYDWLRTVLAERTDLACFGYLAFDPELAMEERHLGLVPAAEQRPASSLHARLEQRVQSTLDVQALIEAAHNASQFQLPDARLFVDAPDGPPVRIAVAQDRALNFYYRDNLDLLQCLGAEIVPFSLLEDDRLPDAVDGVYLGGGFPEMHAEALASRVALHAAMREFHASGRVIYAECGGLMVLCDTLTDLAGRTHRMIGLVPANASMRAGRLTLGYVEVEILRGSILGEAGTRYAGQRFHASNLERARFEPALALRQGGKMSRDGYGCDGLLATYVHAHFAGAPHLARSIVQHCRRRAAANA